MLLVVRHFLFFFVFANKIMRNIWHFFSFPYRIQSRQRMDGRKKRNAQNELGSFVCFGEKVSCNRKMLCNVAYRVNWRSLQLNFNYVGFEVVSFGQEIDPIFFCFFFHGIAVCNRNRYLRGYKESRSTPGIELRAI